MREPAEAVTDVDTLRDLGDERPLGRLIAVNLGWGFLGQAASRIVTAGTGVALARILAPNDFGVYAVATVIVELLLTVNDLGVVAAIARQQGDVTQMARTAMSLTAVSSGVVYLLCFALAPSLAAALNVPDATLLLRVVAVVVLIDAVCAAPSALITRALRQDRRVLAELAGLAVYATLTVVLAKQGLGVWCLVWGRVAASVVTGAALTALAPQRPLPGFDRSAARGLLRFGLPMTGSLLLGMFLINLDYIVVGRALGPVQLGFYLLAFNLCSWPVQLIFLTVERVAVVGFARLAGDRRALDDALNRSMALLAAGVVPACLIIGLLAGPAVRVLYGDRWSPAADALRFLAIFGGMRVIEALITSFLVAMGRTLAMLGLAVAWLATLLPAIILGANLGGIQGVGVAHAVVAGLVVLPLGLLTVRSSGVHLLPFLRRLLHISVAGLVAAAVILLVDRTLTGDVSRLLIAGTAGSVAYSAVALTWRDLRDLLRGPRASTCTVADAGGTQASLAEGIALGTD